MSSIPSDLRTRPRDAVAGFLAAAALFLGLLQLFYRPFRLVPVAVIFVLAATVMSREHERLTGLAVAVIAICFVAGVTLQVLTHHPLF